jgi:hypothetical protein
MLSRRRRCGHRDDLLSSSIAMRTANTAEIALSALLRIDQRIALAQLQCNQRDVVRSVPRNHSFEDAITKLIKSGGVVL